MTHQGIVVTLLVVTTTKLVPDQYRIVVKVGIRSYRINLVCDFLLFRVDESSSDLSTSLSIYKGTVYGLLFNIYFRRIIFKHFFTLIVLMRNYLLSVFFAFLFIGYLFTIIISLKLLMKQLLLDDFVIFHFLFNLSNSTIFLKSLIWKGLTHLNCL